MELTDAMNAYLAERRGELANSTWLKHAMTLTTFAHHAGAVEVDAIDRADLITWRSNLRINPSSANQYMKRIRIFYQWCEDNGHVTRSPARGIKPLDEPPPHRVRLATETFPLMLDTARHPRDRALIATAIELLLRGGELARLRVGDFRGDTLVVHVEKKKGVFSEDEMAISAALERGLVEWLDVYRSRTSRIVQPDDFLFPRLACRRDGSVSVYTLDPSARCEQPWEVVKLALLNSGVPVDKGTGFHAIRRTAARLLFDCLVDGEGMDRALGHVSSLLHHDSRRTTELYLGVTGDRALRNKLVRNGGPTPLSMTLANADKADGVVSALSEVPRSRSVTV